MSLWPDYFWGIGSESKEEDKESYDQIFTTEELRLMYEVANGFFIGAGTRYYYYNVLKKESGSLTSKDIYGRDSAQGLGFSLNMLYDTRDDNVRPLKGTHIKFDALYNTSTFGFSEPYVKLSLDARQYIHIPQTRKHIDHVFAFNLIMEANFGKNIPFQELASLAGRTHSRGIIENRYLDYNMAVIQLEYRFYYKWLGFVVFGAFADVGEKFGEALHFSKITYGLGLRIKPFKNLPFTIRGDMGIHNLKPLFYIGVNEVF